MRKKKERETDSGICFYTGNIVRYFESGLKVKKKDNKKIGNGGLRCRKLQRFLSKKLMKKC